MASSGETEGLNMSTESFGDSGSGRSPRGCRFSTDAIIRPVFGPAIYFSGHRGTTFATPFRRVVIGTSFPMKVRASLGCCELALAAFALADLEDRLNAGR
jgi:hypothetical protein